jgi:hypothetical protein
MTCPDNLLHRPVLYCLVLTAALERYVWNRDKWRIPIKRQTYLGMNGEAKVSLHRLTFIPKKEDCANRIVVVTVAS